MLINSLQRLRQLAGRPWIPPRRGKAPYLWLLMLSFLFWKYMVVAPTWIEIGLLAATALLFVPVYFASYWCLGSAQALVIALTCLFGVVWAPFNFGASTFFIFACAMAAAIKTPRNAYCTVLAIVALAVATAWRLPGAGFNFLVPVLIVGTTLGFSGVMEAQLRRSRDQLLRKQEEVEQMATIAERERISRDLHDLLGHTLSLITLKAELAGKLFERDPDACRREIGDIEHSARAALSEVRSAVSGYRQTGFAHELTGARASLAAAGIALRAEVQAFALPPACENVMSLALREAVTNIVRHAGATECALSLALEDGMIVLRVADNGARLADGAAVRPGNGLTGMQERIAALGGKLALRVERGLALELRLPAGAAA
ncbi:sensor histidine kinase [Massilia sp. R2A-15]|uniref:sensor histidine kinase n=1 Tax=Massilia sp. R2A-15 TaxID=3064278 RepID=UPI002735949C|nr:sensor histidine kinase [Massilia sp. R2A-15]WLI90425.1 sensor histidine kinase [Massilia sp. R2A-15]